MVKRELNYRLIGNLSKLLERASEQIAARKKYYVIISICRNLYLAI